MLYHYTAIDKDGMTLKGDRESPDEKTLARKLREEGMFLTAVAPNRLPWLKNFNVTLTSRVSLVDRMIFARNVAVMIGAGLSMTRALEALEEQSKSKRFKAIINDLKKQITTGLSFSEALKKYRDIFGDFFVHMVEAGEASGKLEGSLKLLSRQMKRDHDLRSKVRGAMIYPAVIITALVGIGVLMMIYVVPTLSQTFQDLKIDLPLTTRLVIFTSNFFKNYAVYALGGLIIVGFVFWRIVRSEKGTMFFDRVVLYLPVLGPLFQKLNAARMTRTLASLISAGLSITRALEITSKVLGNVRFRESIESAIGEMEKGTTLSVVLKKYPQLYSPLITEMISVGEETGTLSRMLIRIALFYEEEVNATTKNISSIIEPALMIVIGIVVGFFAISLIQPLYSSLANQ